MTDALAFLHSCHLVHTQLSSHAVMMVGGRQAKLAQLEGVVQAESKFQPQKRSSWDEILPWVAPELVMGGRKAEQRSDVYSLNCLIWEAVTYKVPWQGLSAEEVEKEVEQHASLPLETCATSALMRMPESTENKLAGESLTKELLLRLAETFSSCFHAMLAQRSTGVLSPPPNLKELPKLHLETQHIHP